MHSGWELRAAMFWTLRDLRTRVFEINYGNRNFPVFVDADDPPEHFDFSVHPRTEC